MHLSPRTNGDDPLACGARDARRRPRPAVHVEEGTSGARDQAGEVEADGGSGRGEARAVPPPSPPIPGPPAERARGRRALGGIGSLLVHAAIVLLIATAARDAAAPRRPPEKIQVAFEVVEKPRPPAPLPPPREAPMPPPPPPPPSPAPAPAPPPKPRPRPPSKPRPLPPLPRDAPPPPPEVRPSEAPPPPNQPPSPAARPTAPVRIGISLSSTSTAGSFAAPVGNTLYGASPKVAADPASVTPYASPDGRYAPPAAGHYVPPSRVSRLPKVSREVRAVYPEAARRAGIEGQVVLRLRIGAEGQVVEARVLESAGHGFDEAALAAVRQFSFEPGTLDGAPVATDITYTHTFLLD